MRFLLCYDGSPHADYAMSYVQRLTRGSQDSAILLTVCVRPESFASHLVCRLRGDTHVEYLEEARNSASQMLTKAVDRFKAGCPLNISLSTEIVVGSDVRSAVLDFAVKQSVDLLVVGSRGLSPMADVRLGSTATYLASHARVPTLVCHLPCAVAEAMRYMVIADDSTASDSAAAAVARLVRPIVDNVILVSAFYDLERFDHDKIAAQETVARLGRTYFAPIMPKDSVRAVAIRTDHIRGGLMEFALKEEANIIAMGSRGRGAVTGVLLGSVSSHFLHNPSCPALLVVRASAGKEDAASPSDGPPLSPHSAVVGADIDLEKNASPASSVGLPASKAVQ